MEHRKIIRGKDFLKDCPAEVADAYLECKQGKQERVTQYLDRFQRASLAILEWSLSVNDMGLQTTKIRADMVPRFASNLRVPSIRDRVARSKGSDLQEAALLANH